MVRNLLSILIIDRFISIWRLKENSTILTRLRLRLQGLECEVRYMKGRENVVADLLSRLPGVEMKEIEAENHTLAVVTRQQMKNNIICENNKQHKATEETCENLEQQHWEDLLKITIDNDPNENEMRRKEQLKDMQQVDKTKFKNYKPGNERIEVDRVR